MMHKLSIVASDNLRYLITNVTPVATEPTRHLQLRAAFRSKTVSLSSISRGDRLSCQRDVYNAPFHSRRPGDSLVNLLYSYRKYYPVSRQDLNA